MTARDEVTATLLTPWLKGSEAIVTHGPEHCVVSVEVLACALDDESWVEAVLESGAWLKTLNDKNNQHRPF